jgi:uncharacterized protein
MATVGSVTPKKGSHKALWLSVAAVLALVIVVTLLLPDTADVVAGFSLRQIVFLEVVFFFAGLMSGLSGFGFSGVGAASMVLIPPILDTPLLQSLSTANQLLSVGQLKQDMPHSWKAFWEGPGPYIIGGLPGSVIGIWLLTHLPARELMVVFGSILVIYSIYSIFRPIGALIHGCNGPLWGGIVGFLGGTLGGFTAFPGALVVVWSSLRDLPRAQSRSIVQPYIIMSQIYALALLAWLHPGVFNHHYWVLLALTMPAVLPGTFTGVAAYKHISDVNCKRISYVLLGLSGAVLLVKVLMK